MRKSDLVKIIKEEIKKLSEQNTPPSQGSCNLPPNYNGPFPNNFIPQDWSDSWVQRGDSQGCTWVKTKYLNWVDRLGTLQAKQPPKCNPKWQSMLNFKMKTAQTNFPQCNL